MSQEHLTFFEPQDVFRVVLRCRSCSGEVSFPLNRMPGDLSCCPVCQVGWTDARGLNERGLRYLREVVNGLSRLESPEGSTYVEGLAWTVRLAVLSEDPQRGRQG